MSSNVETSKVSSSANNEVVPFSRRFPKDIETIIFEIACYHERVIPIHMSESIVKGLVDADEQPQTLPFLCFRSSNPVPAVMHVNANAREIALRRYKLAFSVEDEVSQKVRDLDKCGFTKGRIYVNPTIDIICADTGLRWSLFMRKMRDLKIEKIALNRSSFFSPFESSFVSAVCPNDGSHNSEWVDENVKITTLWTHIRPTELYSKEINRPPPVSAREAYNRTQVFNCCIAMYEANQFTKRLAVLQMLQQQDNEMADRKGRDRQRLDDCPEWLYKNLYSWKRPRNIFLLHWQ